MTEIKVGGRVVHVDVKDEKGRVVTYIVQVGPSNSVSCWTADAPGGTITLPQLFAACCLNRAAREAK
jgi:hypothetical protein